MQVARVLEMLDRRVRGSTQAAVAAEFGVSTAYLSDVLSGKRNPGPKILRALGLESSTHYRRSQPTNGN